MKYYGKGSSCSLFPDRLKAGNPCNLLRKPGLPRLPDQKEPEILEDLSPVSFKFCRGEEEGTEFHLGLCLPWTKIILKYYTTQEWHTLF